MKLATYQAKRKFELTPEPSGTKSRVHDGKCRFVVQKHAASHLHYDFRLELDGVLKSWAIPKGIPTKRGEKRLAMQVEDHPLDYANFEGIIPKGNYGAGTVMLWDRGTYEVIGGEAHDAFNKGKMELCLHGKKLQSNWTLVRMRTDEDGKAPWLLIKTGHSIPIFSQWLDNYSVLSGRRLKAVADFAGRPKQPGRPSLAKRATFNVR